MNQSAKELADENELKLWYAVNFIKRDMTK